MSTPNGRFQFINTTDRAGVLVIAITSKELRDSEIVYALRDEMISAVTESQSSRIVVDFELVEFVGSIGLLALLALRRHPSAAEGRIVICNARNAVRATFEACRLISTKASQTAPFELGSTVEAAVASLSD